MADYNDNYAIDKWGNYKRLINFIRGGKQRK